jgi:hypothetical protein
MSAQLLFTLAVGWSSRVDWLRHSFAACLSAVLSYIYSVILSAAFWKKLYAVSFIFAYNVSRTFSVPSP